MKFAEFFDEVKVAGIEVRFDHGNASPEQRLSNEALFHLPLIAITVLMISKGRVKPVVDQLGQLVGDCFERAFPAFRGSAQHLGWSATLRVRTVQALTFLEHAQLVEVDPKANTISATALGRAVIERALASAGDLAITLIEAERSYRNMRVERQLRLSPV